MQRRLFSQQRPRVDWFLASSIGVVALLVIFLAVTPAIVVRSLLLRDTALSQRIDPMAASASTIANLLVDEEASERGYIITANESFLIPYNDSRNRLEALWPAAEAQASAVGGEAPALLAAVRRSAVAWQTQAAEAEIMDVRAGYQQDAASAVSSGRSQTLFTQFRSDSDALSAYLARLRSTQTAARDRDLSRLDIAENVLVGFGLLALALLFYVGARYISFLRRVVLAESEARFRNIVETANEGVWLMDRQARTVLANQRMAELLDVSPEELVGRSLLDFCFTEDLDEARRHLWRNFAGASEQFDFRFCRADGAPMLVLAGTSPVRDAAGAVIGALGMFSDITARKKAEAERNDLLVRVQEARDAAEAARQRLSLLAAASQRLAAASNDLQAVLETSVRETAEALGDAGILRLVSERADRPSTTAAYHRDPAVREQLLRLAGQGHGHEDATTAEAMRRGSPVLVPVIQRREPQGPANADRNGFPHDLVVYSRVVAPVHAGNRLAGTLEALRLEPGLPYTIDDEVLLQDLADRTGLAIENARLYRDAVEALRTRDEFLSAITHDLRSPLTSVRGFAQIMLRRVRRGEALEQARVEGWLSSIEKTTERMSAMLNEVLDLAQLRDGRPLHLNPQRVDLVALTRQLAEETQSSTEEHPIVVQAGEEEVVGFWDPVRLSRVITNLLSNAVKYSPAGGTVTVSVRRCAAEQDEQEQEGWAELRVRDEGLGISPEDLTRIFDRFERGKNVGGISGLGIGLAAARQIVEQHGGTLTAESTVGHGSVFIVRLPLAGAEPDEE